MTFKKQSDDRFLQIALIVLSLAMSVGLGMFAYLGIFSRYSSDDYCLSAFFLSGDFIDIMTRRYLVSSSRYTNILFIGLVDNLFGWYNVAILPALMLFLFRKYPDRAIAILRLYRSNSARNDSDHHPLRRLFCSHRPSR